ncbi:MAG: putative lipid II flippase FtsW [Gaiellaceae bacterium MAG52_C11]|nr:putative lipid II flippase FtsW [Candidatus Gaiellasilicea maunaloa]
MNRGQLAQRILVLVTLSLVAFGLVMVYSATSAAAAIGNGDPMTYLKRQGIYAALGIALMLAASRLDNRKLRLLAPPLVLVALGLCALLVLPPLVGIELAPEIKGARRWIPLGPASFQPSELAKVALLLFAAMVLARKGAPRTLGELWRPIGLLTCVFSALILLQPDLGTTISLVLMLAGMLVVAGVPTRVLAAAGGIAVTVGLAAIWVEPYRRARVLSFLDPWQDAQGSGFQNVQAIIGMGSGGLTGEGLGHGIQKINYLPEAHTDMIFAIVGEELGLVGTAAVIAAFGAFAFAGFAVALRCRNPFGKLVAAGVTSLVCGQAAVNLAAVMGIAPLTGIPLPFVSYGGSSLVILLGAVGIVLNIAGDERAPEKRAARRPALSDRRRRNGGPRPALARGGGSPARARGGGDVRRVAGSRRG